MADEKRVNNETQEEVVIPKEMQLEEGEILRIRVVDYNPETEEYNICVNANGNEMHIMQALTQICHHFNMCCVPKDALSLGIMMMADLEINETPEE